MKQRPIDIAKGQSRKAFRLDSVPSRQTAKTPLCLVWQRGVCLTAGKFPDLDGGGEPRSCKSTLLAGKRRSLLWFILQLL